MALRLISRTFAVSNSTVTDTCLRMMSSKAGSGAGKGGGSGGSIRESGGAFGEVEAAREEEFFRKLQKEQLDKLKDDVKDEIKHHKEALERHQKRLDEIEKKSKR